MKHTKLLLNSIFAAAAFFFLNHADAQTSPANPSGVNGKSAVHIYGTIFDESQRFGLPGVSVTGSNGKGTVSDSTGHYSISLPLTDSISFSYIGRGTTKIPVDMIPTDGPLNVSLNVTVEALPTAFVTPRNYTADSIQNRKDYQKVFDYNGSTVSNMRVGRGAGLGVGLDLDIIFDGKKNRQMKALQARLEYQEKSNYIDHKFNRGLVHRLTGLEGNALDTFMRQYRPTREFIESCETDYEYYHYIQEWGKLFADWWKDTHPDAAEEPKKTAPATDAKP